jgi:broad-specificity NMP kinase
MAGVGQELFFPAKRSSPHHSKFLGKSKFDFEAQVTYNPTMHKIAFSGIPGSGKSSILAEVKKLLSLKYRVEDIPDLKANGPFDFDMKTGFVSQFYFITSQINEENIRAQGRPDFLLCDGSLLDHWLEWQDCLGGGEGNGQPTERIAMMDRLYRFWLPTYAAVFRLRADAKVLKKRLPKAGLKEYALERSQQADERFGRLIQQEHLPAFDVWNHQTIDESAQEVMVHLADLKLI